MTKVELPGFGDQARWLPISTTDLRSAYYMGCNRGKRSITIDVRTPAGRDVFARLAEQADVVITNFKPGTMDAWGLGYEALAARNPRLVYATGSAFGPIGPDAEREGADLSAQAAGGLINATGSDDGEPTTVAVTIADHISSLNLVSGVLAALLARERTGRGQRVDVSLLGSQIWAQASEYTFYLSSGELPGRPNRGHPMIAGLYGIMPTADGWIAIVGVRPDAKQAFYEAIGRPDLIDDARFATPLLSKEQKAELFAILADGVRRAHDGRVVRRAARRRPTLRPGAHVRRGGRRSAGVGERLPRRGRRSARRRHPDPVVGHADARRRPRHRTSELTRWRCSPPPGSPTTSSLSSSPPAPSTGRRHGRHLHRDRPRHR